MGQQLDTYKQGIDRTNETLGDVKALTDQIASGIGVAQLGILAYQQLEESTEKTNYALVAVKALLGVVGYITPLKTPVNALKATVAKVEKTTSAVEDDLESISSKGDDKGPADSKIIDNLSGYLTNAGYAVDAVRDPMTLKLLQLETASLALANFQRALAAAERDGEGWSGNYTALAAAVEAQLAARNARQQEVTTLDATVNTDLGALTDTFDSIDFSAITDAYAKLEAILGSLTSITEPLAAARTVVDPILGLLNTADALSALIVDPVIEYVLETIGLDTLVDIVTEQLETLLPPGSFLEGLDQLAADIRDDLLAYIEGQLQSADLLDLIEEAYFNNVVGNADSGPTGWGSRTADTLRGDSGDDILDGLAGDDEILAGAGNDVIIAGDGSDYLYGDVGDDLFYFDASFTEYEISRDPDNDHIIVSHLAPQTSLNTGIDTLGGLDDTDHVVFTDITFTGAELKSAIIGGSILDGTSGDDLMFLNSTGLLVDGGFYFARGFDGDDRIFGSTEDDRLDGGNGNDVLIPGLGDDVVNGNAGVDTFQVLSGARSKLTIDLIDGTSFGQGRDTLSSIENVLASPDQDHKIQGNEAANTIYTGDGIDVISGRGGDDLIDAGGEDDYIVGGSGSDVIHAGAGNRDVMISGSAPQAGVSDTYIGGEGTDIVSYSSNSNTIKFDINDQGDDPSILQELKDYLSDQPSSGTIRYVAGTDVVERYDDAGTLVARDVLDSVEGIVGSDGNDRLFGHVDTFLLHGGGGDDTIRTGATQYIEGGDGDDLIYAETSEESVGTRQIDGGAGYDTLLLEEVGDARWFYRIESAIALTLRAHAITVQGDDLRNAREVFYAIKPYSIEEIQLGDYDDHLIYEPGGTSLSAFYLHGGNDRFDAENGFAEVFAGDGNDIGNFDGGGGGIFHGEAGDDYAVFGDTDRDNQAQMGAGEDFLEIKRFFGHANGDTGYDRIAFNLSYESRIEADLAAGTVVSFKGASAPTTVTNSVGMTLENFEVLIATPYDDLISGSGIAEQLIGRAGDDTIEGGAGDDKLYGGLGADSLYGEAGDDLLHGGPGNDRIDGGAGRDTASYAWARPEAEDGALVAGQFGDVTVDLAAGIATGNFGTDALVSIENAIGGGGDDRLIGTDLNNMLSGGDGNDSLSGNLGDDILVTGGGDDTADAGGGNDRVVVGLGTNTLDGGAGIDTLDFGTVDGRIEVDLGTGDYRASITIQSPRWSDRDLDNDGTDERTGTEARIYDGVALTPQLVLEAEPYHANSADDLTRVLPDASDPAYGDFLIERVDVIRSATGSFSGFEAVATGSGDDRLHGDDSANRLSAGEGDDTVIGSAGADALTGDAGDDLLIGGDVADVSTETGAKIFRVYQATLARFPDSTGYGNWSDRLESGERNLLEVIEGFVGSPEFQATYGALGNTAFVTLLYQNVLGRAPDATGLGNWVTRLENGMSRAEVVRGFSESGEFKTNTNDAASAYVAAETNIADRLDDAFRLYQATLDRAPDLTGLENWATRLEDGSPYVTVANGFVASAEFQSTYGALDNEAFVTQLYQNVLGRAPDATGLSNWTQRLDDGMSRAAVVQGFAQAPEFVANTEDAFMSFMRSVEGDTFDGGAGDDLQLGSFRADHFVFDAADSGRDRVLQIDPWDIIELTGFGYQSRSEALAQFSEVGRDTVFTDGAVSVVFANSTLASFEDVTFVL